MLADVHPRLEDEERHDDRHDGPEDRAPGSWRSRGTGSRVLIGHWITLVARVRMACGISRPSFCAALRLTVRYELPRAGVGTSDAGRPPSIAWASSPGLAADVLAARERQREAARPSGRGGPRARAGGSSCDTEKRSICCTTAWERMVSSARSTARRCRPADGLERADDFLGRS